MNLFLKDARIKLKVSLGCIISKHYLCNQIISFFKGIKKYNTVFKNLVPNPLAL